MFVDNTKIAHYGFHPWQYTMTQQYTILNTTNSFYHHLEKHYDILLNPSDGKFDVSDKSNINCRNNLLYQYIWCNGCKNQTIQNFACNTRIHKMANQGIRLPLTLVSQLSRYLGHIKDWITSIGMPIRRNKGLPS